MQLAQQALQHQWSFVDTPPSSTLHLHLLRGCLSSVLLLVLESSTPTSIEQAHLLVRFLALVSTKSMCIHMAKEATLFRAGVLLGYFSPTTKADSLPSSTSILSSIVATALEDNSDSNSASLKSKHQVLLLFLQHWFAASEHSYEVLRSGYHDRLCARIEQSKDQVLSVVVSQFSNQCKSSKAHHHVLSNLLELYQDATATGSFLIAAAGLVWRISGRTLGGEKATSGEEVDVLEEEDVYENDQDEAWDVALDHTQVYDTMERRKHTLRSHSSGLPEESSSMSNVRSWLTNVTQWEALIQESVTCNDLSWTSPLAAAAARWSVQPHFAEFQEQRRSAKLAADKNKKVKKSVNGDKVPPVPRLMSMFAGAISEEVCSLVYVSAGRDFDKAVTTLQTMTGESKNESSSSESSSKRKEETAEQQEGQRLCRRSPLLPFLPNLRPRYMDIWQSFESTYGALRVAGDVTLRSTIAPLDSACYMFCMWLHDYLCPLTDEEFDRIQHPLPLATGMSQVVVFLQSLQASAQHRPSSSSSSPSSSSSSPSPFLQPFLLNACNSVYNILLHHHRRSPWIRNTSDVDESTRAMLALDRQLRSEQDQDYMETMEADREKLESKRRKASELEEESRRRDKEQEAEQVTRQQKQENLLQKKSWFEKEEKERRGAETSQIRLKFPNGLARTITLAKETSIEKLFDFVDIVLDETNQDGGDAMLVASFCLVSNYPKKRLQREEIESTLETAGLHPRAVLLVEFL